MNRDTPRAMRGSRSHEPPVGADRGMNMAQALELAGLLRRAAELLEASVGQPVEVACDLSVAQVAKRLGRSESTVRGWLENRVLHGYKLPGDAKHAAWRVTAESLESFRNRGPSRDTIGEWRKGRGKAA